MNKLINVVIENSIWFTMIRPRFRFRINPFKSSQKISKSEFSLKKISKIEKKNQLGTQFTSSHDKNMTTIYITNYQKSFIARFNSSKIIRNFKNFKISFRHQFQGQLKKSLTNSTDSKKIEIKTASDWLNKMSHGVNARMWQLKVIICRYMYLQVSWRVW